MKTYYPIAKHREKSGAIVDLFTQDGFISMDEAQDQIRIWADDYDFHLISAEIKIVWNCKHFKDDIVRVF